MENTWPGWENKELLGEGSFGKVYKISKVEFGTTYEAALKVISIPQTNSDIEAAYAEGMDVASVTEYFKSCMEDIVAEFALMSQLKGNSNIVSYEDHMVVQHEDGIGWDIFIRMELLTPLVRYIKEHNLTEQDVIRMGIHLSRALALCQKRGILHRDIKPENIFLSKDGNYKLGDFGVARIAEKTVSAMSRKGTYTYMAPEVYKGEEYGYTADLYSLGIVLYRFLNDNRTPFLPDYPQPIQYQDRERALNDRIMGKNMPYPSNGCRELKEIVMKACAFNPSDRFQSAEELEQALLPLERVSNTYSHKEMKHTEESTHFENSANTDKVNQNEQKKASQGNNYQSKFSNRMDDYTEETVSAFNKEKSKSSNAAGRDATYSSGNNTGESHETYRMKFDTAKSRKASQDNASVKKDNVNQDKKDNSGKQDSSQPLKKDEPAPASVSKGRTVGMGVLHGVIMYVACFLCEELAFLIGVKPYHSYSGLYAMAATFFASIIALAIIYTFSNLIHSKALKKKVKIQDVVFECILAVFAIPVIIIGYIFIFSLMQATGKLLRVSPDEIYRECFIFSSMPVFVMVGVFLFIWSKTLRKKFVKK